MNPNPLVVEALGSIVRAGLNIGAGLLISHGIWSASDAEKYVGALALALISLGWSYWQHSGMRAKFVTAMAMVPVGVTERQVEAAVKDKTIETPSVSLRKNEVPVTVTTIPPIPPAA
jgi:hypothetical protein